MMSVLNPIPMTALAVSLLAVCSAPAQEEAEAEEKVQIELLANTRDLSGATESFTLGVRFKIAPHWHIYWKSPGDSGAPTEVEITAPEGFEVGPVLWPRPQRFEGPEGVTYGYEDEVMLLAPVTRVHRSQETTLEFTADAFWLVCRQQCLMGEATTSTTVQQNAGPLSVVGQHILLFRAWQRRVPTPLDEIEGAAIKFDGQTLRLVCPAEGHAEADFYPIETPGVSYGRVASSFAHGRVELVLPVTVKPRNALGKPLRLSGLVILGEEPTDPAYEFTLPLDGIDSDG